MAKSTISESMPTRALRDQVVPDAPLAERPLVPKPYAASKGRNLRDKYDTRLSLGAVNVRSGNLVYFDPGTQVIGPERAGNGDELTIFDFTGDRD